MQSLAVWITVFQVLLVRGAGPEDPSPECSDEDVRLLTNFEDNDEISAALDGVLGDVRGALEICENELWKRVVLCLNEGDLEGEQWTTENTAVACRELGYPAPGQSGACDIQIAEENKRLSYIPQCMGSEERLRDCTTVDHGDSCAIPLVISCWDSSEITTIQTPVTLLTSTSSLVSSGLTQTSTLYSDKQSSSSSSLLENAPFQTPSAQLSSPLPTRASTSGERCWLMFVYGVLVGAVAGAGTTGPLALCYLNIKKRNIQSNETLSGEGDEMERNPAYQTSASLILSSSNPSYAGVAGLNVTANAQVYEDVSAL